MENKTIYVSAAGLLLLAVLAVLGVFLLSSALKEPAEYTTSIVKEGGEDTFFEWVVTRIPARGNITELKLDNKTIKIGVSADTNELNFGVAMQNMTIRKPLNVKNEDRRVKICVVAYGDIKSVLSASPKESVMETGQQEIIVDFSGNVVGSYSGEVDVLAKKPKYEFMEFLLPYAAC